MTDYYNTLGVHRGADQDEIKQAFRRMAAQHHPDRGGDTAMFQEVQAAYATLSDPEKRQQYDNPRPQADINMNSQNMNDIFGQFFRQAQRPRKNQDVTINVRITLNDVMTGKDIVGRYRLSTGREEIATIRLPAGVESGIIMRYQGLGDDAVRQLPRGDLNVQIIVENHPDFIRDRSHIRTKCSINVLQLIVGTSVIIKEMKPIGKKIKPP